MVPRAVFFGAVVVVIHSHLAKSFVVQIDRSYVMLGLCYVTVLHGIVQCIRTLDAVVPSTTTCTLISNLLQ